MSRRSWWSGLVLAAACVHAGPAPRGPEGVGRAYAQALKEGRLDEAFALTQGLDREGFDARYGSPADRERRAQEVLAAAEGATAPVKLELSAGGWKIVEAGTPAEPSDAALAKKTLEAFLAAVDGGDFEQAYHRLAAPLRARYTPARLKADFLAEPKAKERLDRLRAARDGKWQLTADGAALPLGEGKRFRLAREGGELFVGALE